MQFFTKISNRPHTYQSIPQSETACQSALNTLESMLVKNEMIPLEMILNNSVFDDLTLATLLFNTGHLTEASDASISTMIAMMIKTKSYTPKVLANILVDALERKQDQYVSLLMDNERFKEKVLNKALHVAEGRGHQLNDSDSVTGELIRLGANLTFADEISKTALAVADSCKYRSLNIQYI